MSDARGFYSDLGVELPESSRADVSVRCFAAPDAHRSGDRNPSCSVNTATGVYICFACDQRGGPYDAAIACGRTPAEAMELLRAHDLLGNGREPERHPSPFRAKRPISEAEVSRYRDALARDTHARWAIKAARGYTDSALERLELGIDQGRLTFPLRDSTGRLVGLVRYAVTPEARGRGPKALAAPGSRRELFPAPETVESERLYVVEGEPDVVSAWSVGLPAVGVPGASTWQSEWPDRFRGREVVICFDCDEPGRKAAGRVAADLAGVAANVRVLDLAPTREDGYDVGDLVREAADLGDGGREQCRALLDRMAASARLVPAETRSPEPAGSAVPSPPVPGIARDRWPAPPSPAAMHGIIGDAVREIEPHSEADAAALLIQVVVLAGAAIGKTAHFTVEADLHFCNLFATIVGETAKARKGSSLGQARRLVTLADATLDPRVMGGSSTGEGLIHHVRDPVTKRRKAKTKEEKTQADVDGYIIEEVDEGVEDKRLVVTETEFAAVLARMGRDGNTLSAVLRQAWDGSALATLTKNSPSVSTHPHIAVIAHITEEELDRELNATEMANGFANRFMWFMVRRSKELPFGGNFALTVNSPIVAAYRDAFRFARTLQAVDLDASARTRWASEYGRLSRGDSGMFGAITSRAEAQVRRLAVVYAVMDLSPVVTAAHLEAALALWEYSERSCRYLFGSALGDPVADDILAALRRAPDGLTRTQLSRTLQGHAKRAVIGRALEVLRARGFARVDSTPTDGRPEERWHAT